MQSELGTIESGKLVDIIDATGDPLNDITELQCVIFFIKESLVIKTP